MTGHTELCMLSLALAYFAISLLPTLHLWHTTLAFMKITQEVVDVHNTYNLGHFISLSFGAH